MFEILISNFGFWFNLGIPILIALYLSITHKEYIWKEFGIQVGATVAYVFVIYSLLFSFTTDLVDTEYWNSKVSKFEYYEAWKERVTYTESYSCGTTKSPKTCSRTKTRIDHHPPYCILETTNNESTYITADQYNKSNFEFGQTKVNIHRTDQVSYGDGNKFVSYPNIIIPTSVSHTYENYVVAAKHNVIHTKVSQKEIESLVFKGELRKYPIQYIGKFGELKLERIVNTTDVSHNMLTELDLISNQYGSTKQVNPIIYITKEDRNIKYAIEQYWNKSKKNDVVLILGIDDNGSTLWSDVITWTNNTDFIVYCGNNFEGKNIQTQSKEIVYELGNLIQNEYLRKPMEEFSYLKENITLEWYWQLLVFLGNLLLSAWLFYIFMRNHESKY